MKLKSAAECPLEYVGMLAGIAPTPFLDTMVAMMLSRTIMVSVKVGIFEALRVRPRSSEEIARECGIDPYATQKLLRALEGSGYVRCEHSRYELARDARRWLLKDSKRSHHDAVLMRFLDAAVIENYEEFVRSGVPTQFHDRLTAEQWEIYEKGQRSHAELITKEVAWRTPVHPGAKYFLDIGGGHGWFAREFCRRYPQMRAVIFDLPQALPHNTTSEDDKTLQNRLEYVSGDATVLDLGVLAFDVILLANVAHHLSAKANADLLKRISRALRPKGICVILEIVRSTRATKASQIESLLDLHFAAASGAGTWTGQQLAEWQRNANLRPCRLKRLVSIPEYALQIGEKV